MQTSGTPLQDSSDQQEFLKQTLSSSDQQILFPSSRFTPPKHSPQNSAQPPCPYSRNHAQYLKQFESVRKINISDLSSKYHSEFKSHKLVYHPQQFYAYFCIQKIESTTHLQIQTLRVRVSHFQFTVSILNLETHFIFDQSLHILGSGGFGTIYQMNILGKKYACKNTIFKSRSSCDYHYSIISILKEYCISKICSAMKIGLSVENPLGFDIICYSNCAQFFLECGQNIKYSQNTKTQLIQVLSLMHTIKLIHNDIKPDNVMFSSKYNHHVFIDFGISEFIDQPLGSVQMVEFRGSYKYVSQEMKKLIEVEQKNQVDLYYNDLTGLLITLKQFQSQAQLEKIRSQLQINLKEKYNNRNSRIKKSQERISSSLLKLNISIIIVFFRLAKLRSFNRGQIDELMREVERFPLKQRFYHELGNLILELNPNKFLREFVKDWMGPYFGETQDYLAKQKERGSRNKQRKNEDKYKRFECRLSEGKKSKINQGVQKLRMMIEKIQQDLQTNDYIDWKEKSALIEAYFRANLDKEPFYQDQMTTLMHDVLVKFAQRAYIEEGAEEWSQFEAEWPNRLQEHEKVHFKSLLLIGKLYQTRNTLSDMDQQNLMEVLEELIKFGYLPFILELHREIHSRFCIFDNLIRYIHITFRIFYFILSLAPAPFLSLLKTKIQELYQIYQILQLKDQSPLRSFSNHQCDVLHGQILIKCAKFYFYIWKKYHNKSKINISRLSEYLIEIQELFHNFCLINNHFYEEQQLKLRVLQTKLLFAEIQRNFLKAVQIGQTILSLDRINFQFTISQQPFSSLVLYKLAQAYYYIGNKQMAKKIIQSHQETKYTIPYRVIFKLTSIEMFLNAEQNKKEKTIQNMKYLKNLAFQNGQPSCYIITLLNILIKCREISLSPQIQDFALSEFEDTYFLKKGILDSEAEYEFHRYVITREIQSNTSCYNLDEVNKKMVNFRISSIKLLISQIKAKSVNFDIISKKVDELQKGMEQMSDINSFPPQKYYNLIDDEFFLIHYLYYFNFISVESTIQFLAKVCPFIKFDKSIIALNLHMQKITYELKQTEQLNDQKLIQHYNEVFNYVLEINEQQEAIEKEWYHAFFHFDQKLPQNHEKKFQQSFHFIKKISIFMCENQTSSYISLIKNIYQQFFQIYNHLDNLIQFSDALSNSQDLKNPHLSIFFYSMYENIAEQFNLSKRFDHILYNLIKNYPNNSPRIQNFLDQRLHLLIARRLKSGLSQQFAVRGNEDMKKVKIMSRILKIDKVQKLYEYQIKCNFRNPYSPVDYNIKKPGLMMKSLLKMKEGSQKFSEHMINIVKGKIKQKLEKYMDKKMKLKKKLKRR